MILLSLLLNDTIVNGNIDSNDNPLYKFLMIIFSIIVGFLVIDFVFNIYIFKNSSKNSTNQKSNSDIVDFNNIELFVTVKEKNKKKEKLIKQNNRNITKDNESKSVKPEIIQKSIELKKIGYTPNENFKQDEPYVYPVVKFPEKNTPIKFPRNGRSNRKGHKEDDFFNYLNLFFGDKFNVFNDKHVPQQDGLRIYEPDFIISNEIEDNIFINIEIDEPYEAFSRTPIHIIGQDLYRDIFFTKRGYIVIRFTERQVHTNPSGCCAHIAKVIKSINPKFDFSNLVMKNDLQFEEQWDSLQAKKMGNREIP